MKLTRAERGSDDAIAALEDADHVATCVIAYPETRAGLTRAIGSAADLARARRELDLVWAEIGRLDVDEGLALDAGGLAERHHLRGMDALHLAAALRYAAAGSPEPTVFLSWDRDQREGAKSEGLQVLPKRL